MDSAYPGSGRLINPSQAGGIDAYTIADGPGRGVRVLCVNTGGGLRYRVLVDRGLDIDQAFFNQHSLAFLTHQGVSPPTRALDQGIDWLKGFPGGLLTSCGPFNIGPPGQDEGEDLGLHGQHSTSAAAIESVIQPDPLSGRLDMVIVGVVRYGRLFGPCLNLRRTIRSTLGQNVIEFTDEFINVGNQPTPHAWLLHINFGYPLVDQGAELCYDSPRIEPVATPESQDRFKAGRDYKKVPAPLDRHRGGNEAVAYLYPKPTGRNGQTSVGVVNRKLGLGARVDYNTRQFPRCVNWQHFGPGEYVTALEPANGTVAGRWQDRANGVMDTLEPGERRTYDYRISATTDRAALASLRALNEK